MILADAHLSWGGMISTWGSDDFQVISDTPNGDRFRAIAGAGEFNAMALSKNGSVVVWVSDMWGMVSNAPTEKGFLAISGGELFGLALRSDGSIAAWGYDNAGQVSHAPVETGFTAIAGGSHGALALRADGSIVAWGIPITGYVTDAPPEQGTLRSQAATCPATRSIPREEFTPGVTTISARSVTRRRGLVSQQLPPETSRDWPCPRFPNPPRDFWC